jgi:hypothetical protein
MDHMLTLDLLAYSYSLAINDDFMNISCKRQGWCENLTSSIISFKAWIG